MLYIEKKIKTGLAASFLLIDYSKKKTSVLLVACIFFLTGCNGNHTEIVYTGLVMGTTYEVKIVTTKKNDPKLRNIIDARLQKMNRIFTTYDDTSELMVFNSSPLNAPQAVSSEMIDVLRVSQEIFIKSRGSFDPTVWSLVDLWGFGAVPSNHVIPDHDSISNLLALVGLNNISIEEDNNLVARLRDVKLDLSAIAKGYAADSVSELLNSMGIDSYLVEVGGELRIKGKKANGKNWHIAIEKPYVSIDGVQAIIQVTDSGVATSGDYRNYFEENGKRYSHTIDPRTGYPISHNLVSATVIADTAAKADAFSTAMMVLGPEDAIDIAEENNLAVYLVIKNSNGFDVVFSKAFAPFIIGE